MDVKAVCNETHSYKALHTLHTCTGTGNLVMVSPLNSYNNETKVQNSEVRMILHKSPFIYQLVKCNNVLGIIQLKEYIASLTLNQTPGHP